MAFTMGFLLTFLGNSPTNHGISWFQVYRKSYSMTYRNLVELNQLNGIYWDLLDLTNKTWDLYN